MNSFWISSARNSKKYNKVENDLSCEVCIIGAGMCGLSIGYYLSKSGINTVIVDKDEIGQKTSGHTTAKITLGHNLFYNYLINSFGVNYAKKYFNSNKEAINNIKKIIDNENIDCNFKWQSNYVYALNNDDLQKIYNEIKAINTLEKDYASFTKKIELPIETLGALKLDNQAQFHPIQYMLGLSDSIINYGGKIYTNSLVTDVEKTDFGYAVISNGKKIKCKYVVLASHYPFINFPGFHFLKMYQSTSYALAVDTGTELFDGMYINPSEPTFSFRTAKYGDNNLLIIAGGDHKTGFAPDNINNGYKPLEDMVYKLYPNSKILYKWNTRDCISLDKIPYIGKFSNIMPNMYLATGFKKWGMTLSNVAANIICDDILGIDNKYSEIYNSTRFKPLKNKDELKNMISQTYKSFVSNRIKIPKESLSAIKNDNGGIIKIDGNSVGIYKDKVGNIFAVNPTCTHLGCLLTWNNIDKTWDCPCHGSRFDFNGKNIYDPAFKDLEKLDIY